jgi:hypothetical protein
MLANEITLSVDAANDGNPADEDYTRVEEFQNRSVYEGPNHSLVERETLTFYRTKPTKSGNFNGVAKSAAKFSIDVAVDGVDTSTTVVAPLIGEISFSLPIGTTAADAMHLRQRLVALADNDTIMVALSELLHI